MPRSGPGTIYPVVGQLQLNQVCPIVGRNADNSWWSIECGTGLSGWLSDTVLRTVADPDRLPILVVPPPAVVAPPAVSQPPAQVFSGWKSSYFTNRDLFGAAAVVQDVADINFNWGTGSPHPTVPADNFSARYERRINFAPGNYRLTARYDDGVRVYLDGQPIINLWVDGYKEQTRRLSGLAEGYHGVRIEFYERAGTAQIRVLWQLVSAGGIQ